MKKNDVMVSVICIAYNHEKFLRKCLDGFIMQKTNFKFEVIVHDDASTDGTKAIIEEYVTKYPDIFFPIYQTENQYSKGVAFVDNIMFPIAKGKYIAICEGDDYWCNENKLQLQYDFMEEHAECSACFHNTEIQIYNEGIIGYENNWKELHYMNEEDVFKMGSVHTSSFFIKRECFVKPVYGKHLWTGDLVRRLNAYKYGKLAVLPQVMSVYNVNQGAGSVTSSLFNISNRDKLKTKMEDIINYLNIYNQDTDYRYDKYIKTFIQKIDFYKILNCNYSILLKTKDKKEFKKLKKQITKHEYFKVYLKTFSFLGKLKQLVKYRIPFILWKKLMKNKEDITVWMD